MYRFTTGRISSYTEHATQSAVLAGAVIGSFSWFSINDAFWLASGCWYASLVLSVLGILLSAQQMAVFHFLGEIPRSDSTIARAMVDRYRPLLIESTTRNGPGRRKNRQTLETETPRFRPKRSMVFTWQCPMMFMSYSVCLFLLGLTMVVITPLIRIRERGWNGAVNASVPSQLLLSEANKGMQAAIFYLVAAAVAGTAFIFCSFWIYHFVDFESDALLEETEAPMQTASPSCPNSHQQKPSVDDVDARDISS